MTSLGFVPIFWALAIDTDVTLLPEQEALELSRAPA
jgi:hypothetical protein